MKALTLLLLVIGFGIPALSQEYLPLPVEGAEWTRLYQLAGTGSNQVGPGSEAVHFVPAGDTLIGAAVYTRLRASSSESYTPDSSYYLGAYRSEGARSWFWEYGANEPYLLFDFSLQAGDTANINVDCEQWPLCPSFIVHSVDTLYLPDGKPRRQIDIYLHSESTTRYAFSWVEGIGSTLGFFNDYACLQRSFLTTEPQCEYALLCHQQDGALLYTDPELYTGKCYLESDPIGSTNDLGRSPVFELYPNPAYNQISIKMIGVSGVARQAYRIYSSTGELEKFGELEGQDDELDISRLPAGMYTLILPQRGSVSIGRFVKI